MSTPETQDQTLTEFLLARIEEDEIAARSARAIYDRSEPMPSRLLGAYLNPARVLAECAAKRRIVELRESMASQVQKFEGHRPSADLLRSQVIAYDTALRALASVYADHEDYRQEWAL